MTLETLLFPVDPGDAARLVELVRGTGCRLLTPPACTSLEVWLSEDRTEALIVVVWSSEQAHSDTAARDDVQEFYGQVAGLTTGPPRQETYELG